MTQEPDAVTGFPGDPPGIDPLAVTELRLSGAISVAEISNIALDAVVPGLADAAAVFVLEHLLRGGGSAAWADDEEVAVRRVGTGFSPAGTRVSPEAFPTGVVLVLVPESPYARCMRAGAPVSFARPDSRTLERVGAAGREAFRRYTSFLAAPMTSSGAAVGVLALARAPGAPAFSDDDTLAAAGLAAHAGTGIANAITLRRHRSISDTLQHGLLAAEPPRPALLEVAGRCLPAAGNVVGGDWYDIVPLPAGRTGLVVGDVMGHGAEAAAVMAQLRAAARALAQLDPEPAELLRQLDRTTATLRGFPLATCAYAVVDPARRACSLATAGHLPPVLAMPDGTTRTLDLPSGPSLGIGPAFYGQARIKLPPGAVIALYTDGLVETRTRSFDQGILVLEEELARIGDTLDASCDDLIKSVAWHPEDDVTLVLARIPAVDGAGGEIRSG